MQLLTPPHASPPTEVSSHDTNKRNILKKPKITKHEIEQPSAIMVNCSGAPGEKERWSEIKKNRQVPQKNRYRCHLQLSHQGLVFLQGPGPGHGLNKVAAEGEIS